MTTPVTLPDYAQRAQQMLPADCWAYLNGHAADGHTAQANQAAWSDLQLWPRVLRATAGGHTRRTLLGRPLAHPILLAPVASLKLAHPDGELGTACAAAAQQAGLVLSSQASTPLETVAEAIRHEPARGPLWMQLYLQADRGFTRELVQRAEASGYEALVLTADAPVQGVRDEERRTGFTLPPEAACVNLHGLRPQPPVAGPVNSLLFDDLLRHAPTWDDVAWLRSQTRLPLLLKGILHPDDARQAHALGADGVIVSNHGGRTLDTAVSTAWALPRIIDAVGSPAWPVLVDGGLRRGTDVLKALALGAHAVLIGRPYVHGLTVAGAHGVAHVIRLLRDELEVAMALCGCRTLADLHPDLMRPTP